MIARVFPRRTSFSPVDSDCYFDMPGLFTPDYDEVHISCVFTWDKQWAHELAGAWQHKAKVIKVGGPAFNDSGNGFTPGLYLREGVTITSRGCPNSCSWCLVSGREGKLRELDVKPGNIIQDNNILACSAHCPPFGGNIRALPYVLRRRSPRPHPHQILVYRRSAPLPGKLFPGS